MNLLLLKPEEMRDGTAVISGSRAEHIVRVLKAAEGDSIRAGILNGPVGGARIFSISETSVTVNFTPESDPPKAPPVSLILALPRPKVFRRVLFCAVSCGVKDIHIINSWRVEKSYWDSPYIGADAVGNYCAEALSQAKDTVMPRVTFHRFLMGFLDEGLQGIPEDRGRFLAHPYGAGGAKPVLPAVLAVGPEGGFIGREVETFERYGFTTFSAGERTLTTEHFVPFLLGSLIK